MKSEVVQMSKWQIYSRQWITGLAATVIFIEVGLMCGWSSPYYEWLTSPDSPFTLTPDEASWVASLLNLGRVFGAFFGALSLQYVGSKKSLTLTLIPIVCCWIFTIVANSAIWLYAARLLGGTGMGMAYVCIPFFIGEVALPEIRGAILSIAIAGGSATGSALSSVGGAYLSMEISAGVYLAPCILVGLIYLWFPDSPHWLVKKEDYETAKRSISWYQPSSDSDKEVETIKDLVHGSSASSFFKAFKKFKSRPIRRAFYIIIVLYTAMQLTGLSTITFFMETILRRSKFTAIEPATVVIYVSISAILSTFVSMVLIERSGRKILFGIACIGIAVAMSGLGTNAYLIAIEQDMTEWWWLPVVSIFIFVITYYSGMLSVPGTVLGEIFPSDLKCHAGFVASAVAGVWSFAVTVMFQPIASSIGEAYLFWIHGTVAILLIPYIIFCMPETKGKSLQEIQNKFIRTKT